MTTKTAPPYLEKHPGDLITAEDWNELQDLIQQDIKAKAHEAVEELEQVERATDAEKLGGRAPEQWTQEVVAQVLERLHAERGYRMYFKRLEVGKPSEIEHKLGDFPLVDIYQLDYFPAVFCEDKETFPVWTTFYLQHEDEKKVRYTTSKPDTGIIEVLPSKRPHFRLPLMELLRRYKVDVTRCSSLSEVEHELWTAMFTDPNDEFEDDQYGHSPWFDKHCREEMALSVAGRKKYLDDLWIQVRPRKTVNYPGIDSVIYRGESIERTDYLGTLVAAEDPLPPHPAATQIEVVHYDFDTLTVKLLREPFYPLELFERTDESPPGLEPLDRDTFGRELNVMVLLKT